MATAISKLRNITYEEAFKFVTFEISNEGSYPLQDPIVNYIGLEPNGDHKEKTLTFTGYINETIKNEEYLTPTGTTYMNSKKKKSLRWIRLDLGMATRNVYKKKMKIAKSLKDNDGVSRFKNLQNAAKTGNNGDSGTNNSKGNVFYNPPLHSVLCATCRITSGYGNANNEYFLAGNRPYYNADVVLNHISAIITNADLELIEKVMNKYELVYPTVEDTLRVIKKCTNYYWKQKDKFFLIEEYVNVLTSVERAAFCYIGDFYNLRELNGTFIFDFIIYITSIANPDLSDPDLQDPIALFKAQFDTVGVLALQICADITEGKAHDTLDLIKFENMQIIAATAKQINDRCYEFEDFINAFLVTTIMPPTVATFPTSVREVVPISDTDSTMASAQEWLYKYSGNYQLVGTNNNLHIGLAFLASTTIVHILAQMSTNIGIDVPLRKRISMKSEFLFSYIMPTNFGKHYIAEDICQEGIMKEDPDLEKKGVVLNSAAVPNYVRTKVTEFAKQIGKDIRNKGTINLTEYLVRIIKVEKEIIRSITDSEPTFFKNEKLKTPGAYSNPDETKSPYKNHLIWNDTYGQTYGELPPPPYVVRKVPVKLNKAAMAVWLANMEDEKVKAGFELAMQKYDFDEINIFRVPAKHMLEKGIPKSLVEVINLESIMYDIMRGMYMLLEGFGLYQLGEKKIRRLLSDVYKDLADTIPAPRDS